MFLIEKNTNIYVEASNVINNRKCNNHRVQFVLGIAGFLRETENKA